MLQRMGDRSTLRWRPRVSMGDRGEGRHYQNEKEDEEEEKKKGRGGRGGGRRRRDRDRRSG